MRDSLGGTVVLVIIVVFIAIVSAYLAFNVNYMKAFNMKNKIIEYYNWYEGDCSKTCQDKIREYAKTIGYNPPSKLTCPSGMVRAEGGKNSTIYCYSEHKVPRSSASVNISDDIKDRYYYSIATTIDIRIPIVQNVFGYNLLSVSGDTKPFPKK